MSDFLGGKYGDQCDALPSPIKIAIIDDGLEGLKPVIAATVKENVSFSTNVKNPPGTSSCGGIYAAIIRSICPVTEFYSAKIPFDTYHRPTDTKAAAYVCCFTPRYILFFSGGGGG